MSKKKHQARSELSKRAQNALELAQVELGDGESSSDEDYDNHGRRGVVNLLKNSQGDDEGVNGDEGFEDEDLDSDEAMGSDDDYDVMNSKFSQTIRDKRKNNRMNQAPEGNDEEEYTSIDEDELLPLSEVWDRTDGREDSSSDGEGHLVGKLELENDDNDEESSSSDSESSEASESEENPFDELSEDDRDVELNNVTSGLMKDADKQEYRKLNNYGTGKENEFALPSVTAQNTPRKLNLADMMEVVDDKAAASKATLVKGSSSTLSVPLPQRIQQRHERKAAYEISKDEMDKWKDIVQQNRRAEHLNFSGSQSTHQNASSTFTRTPGQSQTELEEKVDKVLQESDLVDPEKGSTFEELATAKISPEDMKKRTAEMRLVRELMFREERKAKRLKKIKSKTYRRIKKKEMLKNKELAGVAAESDEEADVARAKERMTLKHRANSKWAKDMVRHGMTNEVETREEMEQMLRQAEHLKAKILDHNPDEEDSMNLSDIEREEEEHDRAAQEKPGKSGVMNMAFMKTAEAREKEENRKTISALRAAEEPDEVEEEDTEREFKANVELNRGRRIYNSNALLDEKESAGMSKEEVNNKKQFKDGEIEVRHEKLEEIDSNSVEVSRTGEVKSSNPWLDRGDEEDEKNVKQSSKVSVIDKDSTKMAKSLYKLDKQSVKRQNRRENENEDLLLDAEGQQHLNLQSEELSPNFMFKQQDVIAEAFAGDDVVASFEEEKKRVAESEDDKEQDVTLPGWGEWAGAGANPKKKRKFVKKIKGTVAKDKRKDKSMRNVIINEKLNKKNIKYQSSAVPFPFESKEQYERSLRMPIGQEWTSRLSHQKMIKPRILTKPSEVIDPLKAPFK